MTRPTAADTWPAAFRRPEHRLLVCSARVRLDEPNRNLFESLLQEDIDWEYLLEEAGWHRLRPLLYHHLKSTCPDAAPDAWMSRLRDHFHAVASRSLFMTRELLKLLKLFEAIEVPALFYKGPVISSSAYGNLSLREFGDLDVLISERDITKVKDLLLSQGYRPAYPLTPGQEAFHLRTNNEYKFDRREDMASVDLHWEVTPKYIHFPLEPEILWERRQKVSIGGIEVSTFSAEDTLLTLCVHGVFHLWDNLEWICGVAEMVRGHEKMDWGLVMERARALRNERTLFCGLFLARDLLQAPVPEAVALRMEAFPQSRALARQACQRLFREDKAEPGAREKALYHTKALDLARSRASYYFRLATIPNQADWSFLPIPLSLFFLYYAIRPIRLAFSFFSETTRRLRTEKSVNDQRRAD
jgi:hypothetical protein